MTYEALDTRGRIVLCPEQGRCFIRAHKAALAFFAEHPKGTLFLASNYGSPVCSLAEYMGAHRALLDKRINMAGGIEIRESRDGEWALRRDKNAIEDLLIRRGREDRADWSRGSLGSDFQKSIRR